MPDHTVTLFGVMIPTEAEPVVPLVVVMYMYNLCPVVPVKVRYAFCPAAVVVTVTVGPSTEIGTLMSAGMTAGIKVTLPVAFPGAIRMVQVPLAVRRCVVLMEE